jgi:hypothetical protein
MEGTLLAKALLAERQRTGIAPRGERRPGDGRQRPVFTDAVGQDFARKKDRHVDEMPRVLPCPVMSPFMEVASCQWEPAETWRWWGVAAWDSMLR